MMFNYYFLLFYFNKMQNYSFNDRSFISPALRNHHPKKPTGANILKKYKEKG
jgi:hypothetical protein